MIERNIIHRNNIHYHIMNSEILEQFERNKDVWKALFEAERQIGRCDMLCDIVDRERARTAVIDRNIEKQREKWAHLPCPF
jgi:hypothetical protein